MKDIIIRRLFNVMEGQAMFITDNKNLKNYEKTAQLDVVKNVMQYLIHYDDYNKIIQKELAHRKLVEKYKKSKLNKKYNRTETKRDTIERISYEI